MPNNTTDVRRNGQTKGIQGMSEEKEPLQITIAEFPEASFRPGKAPLDFLAKPENTKGFINFRDWCEIQMDRIRKIPGRAPRIAPAKSQSGEYEGKIMVVDDLFTLSARVELYDRAKIREFHRTGKY